MKKLIVSVLMCSCTALIAADVPLSDKDTMTNSEEEKIIIKPTDIFVTCGKGIIKYKYENGEEIIEMPRWYLLKDEAGNYKITEDGFSKTYKVSVEMEGDTITKIFDNVAIIVDLKNEKLIDQKSGEEVAMLQKIDCNCTDIIPFLMAEVIRLPKECAKHEEELNTQWKSKYKELKKRDKEHAEREKQQEAQWQTKYDELKKQYEEKIKHDDERLKAISNEHQYYIERYLARNNQK